MTIAVDSLGELEASERDELSIRPLTVEELPRCESFAQAFHAEYALPGTFSLSSFRCQWEAFLTTPGMAAVILGLFKGGVLIGGFGAMMAPEVNTGRLDANELFWFIEGRHRSGSGALRLLRAFEQWGAAHHAEGFKIVHLLGGPSSEPLARLYQKLGYRPIEVAYFKPREA